MFLSLDQAGRISHFIPAGAPLGGQARLRIAPPPGTRSEAAFDVSARLYLRRGVASVDLVAPGIALRYSSVRTSLLPTTIEVPLGSVRLGPAPVDATLSTTPGLGRLLGLVLTPATRLPLAPDDRQRLALAACVILALWGMRWLCGRPALLGALLAGLLAARYFCLGLVPFFGTDLRNAYFPWYELTRRELQAGRIPLWNPHTLLGLPHLANPQTQVLYPPWALCVLAGLPCWLALGAAFLGHCVVATTGMAALARKLQIGRAGATLAGALYVLSPWVPQPTCPSMAAAHGWLPWVLWAVIRPSGMALPTIVMTMAVLAGFPQPLTFAALAIPLLWRAGPRRAPLRLRRVIAASLLALLMSGAQLLPMIELAAQSVRRNGLTLAHASAGYVSPGRICDALELGWDMRWIPRMPGQRASGAVFLGAAALPLAGAAMLDLARRRHRRRAALLLAAALLGLVLGMGAFAPLAPFTLLWHIPPFSSQRIVSRATIVTTVALSLLCGRGLLVLRALPHRRAVMRLAVLGPLFAGLALVVAASTHHLDAPKIRGAATQAALAASLPLLALLPRGRRRAAMGLVAALAIADRVDDVCFMLTGSYPSSYAVLPEIPGTPRPGSRELGPQSPNDPIVAKRYSAWGYDPAVPMRTAELWARLDDHLFRFDAQGRLDRMSWVLPDATLTSARAATFLRGMGVDRVALKRPVLGDRLPPGVSVRRGGKGLLLDVAGAARAYIVRGISPSRPVLALPVIDGSPSRVEVAFPGARHRSGYLVLADTYYPGWEARADGEPRPIQPWDLSLRAVPLAGRERRIVFTYRPFSFRLGLFETGLGMLALSLLVAGIPRAPLTSVAGPRSCRGECR